jgi:hypothetical protein
MEVKYPNIQVRLSEQDGNAFSIISRVRRAMLKSGVPPDEIEEFSTEAMSGDYDHLLQTAMKWVNVV